MTRNNVTNWILVKLVNYTATTLYSLIKDGNYRETNAGRAEWMSLINGALLQDNCNKEGFNFQCSETKPDGVSTYNKVFYELLFTSNEVQFLLKYSLFYFVLLWLNFGKVKKFKFILWAKSAMSRRKWEFAWLSQAIDQRCPPKYMSIELYFCSTFTYSITYYFYLVLLLYFTSKILTQ